MGLKNLEYHGVKWIRIARYNDSELLQIQK